MSRTGEVTVLTVLYVNGGWVPVAQTEDDGLLVGALGTANACDALTFPPPLAVVPADGAAGFLTLEQLCAWGDAVSDAAAVQTRELAQIVQTWAKRCALTTGVHWVALPEEKDIENV
ncbi:hypothetical protein [Corynebacterium ulceribovis]|uniref:hypothetical protein n=1 Tax=Corynebacterium ulceribovis TaxID=487732 RepID=UPI0003A28919|nr:hypothetical protein [Corynebacterium ulceribovis]